MVLGRSKSTQYKLSLWFSNLSEVENLQKLKNKLSSIDVGLTALAWPINLTLTLNPLRAMAKSYSHAKVQGQQSIDPPRFQRLSGNKRTEAIVLPSPIICPVITAAVLQVRKYKNCPLYVSVVICGWAGAEREANLPHLWENLKKYVQNSSKHKTLQLPRTF